MSDQLEAGQPMIQCPVCKTLLPAGSRFCPNDGTPLTETAALSGVPTPAGALPSTSDMQLPTVVGGRYRLVAVRGGGGMARVYQAVDQTLEREVAVKLINPQLRTDPEFDARFQREARIASKLNDPHIVVVHDFGIDPAHGPFLVMEFLQGQSIREHLQSKGPLPYKAALQMAGQLLLALIHAHGQGIVHRDIKPDNVFLVNISGVRLHVRVLDFGIARIMNREAVGNAQLTSPGAILGTPRYMSPEQLAGLPLDARSDLYSAALVIFEAMTGQLPHARNKGTLRDFCPDAPVSLQELLAACLDYNPDKRPSSALEAFLQLQEMGKASGVLLLPAGAMERLADARRQAQGVMSSGGAESTVRQPVPMSERRKLLIGFGVVCAIALLLFVARYILLLPPATPTDVETLAGIKIGEDQKGVMERLKLSEGGPGNPFGQGRRPVYMARAITAADLGVETDSLAKLEVRRTADERICVIFFEGKVRAVVVRKANTATGRGVRVDGALDRLTDLYPADYDDDAVNLTPEEDPDRRGKVRVRRYDNLGIAFETYGNKVSAISLFPPRAQ